MDAIIHITSSLTWSEIYHNINGTVAEAKMLENLSSSAVGRFHQFSAKLQLVINKILTAFKKLYFYYGYDRPVRTSMSSKIILPTLFEFFYFDNLSCEVCMRRS